MKSQLILKKFIPLILLASVLPFIASFLATPVLRVVRNVFGGKLFWGSGLFVTGLLLAVKIVPIAFFVGSLWILVGAYAEFEKHARTGFWTAMTSVILSLAFLYLGHRVSVQFFAVDAVADLRIGVSEFLKQANSNHAEGDSSLLSWSGVNVDADFITAQLPSVLVILQMVNLAFALMLEHRTASLFRLPFTKVVLHWRLLEFKLPDFFIWPAMLSFLGAFLKLKVIGVNMVSTNFFSVFVALYFFQGLAIMEAALLSFRAGPLMRFFVYFIVVGQLFFVLSAVGFADYWLDFRKRLKKLRLNINNRKHEEQL